ncbi:anhydro-N-acetylmuramic acid kinase AnmK [Bacillus fonticola]|uniref:anhydro-N-acetylmuramic acid kinase AnmK n=1 Tax=Bacillus fonticola TaxID=2728853 RepID=UPI0014755085|nr:anhydro-N-acetylmuramic acid kinase AnmK [Bacillus fonticola]
MTLYIGCMTGTSLDGLDVALIEVTGEKISRNTVRLVDYSSSEYTPEERERLENCMNLDSVSIGAISELNFTLGKKIADAVNDLLEKTGYRCEDIRAIGSHGQTLYHGPPGVDATPSTLQVGEPAVIAYETGILVVSNFRSMDVVAGGQGAPLVPFTEFLLYKGEEGLLLQNIGGIGNVTVLPPNPSIDDVLAFDTGPGNMMIDAVCRKKFNVPYDKGGQLAANGVVHEGLLAELMQDDYLEKPLPKSTGRERYGSQLVDPLLEKWAELDRHDILRTVTEFTARTIELNLRKFVLPKHTIGKLVLGGGGRYNTTLMESIKACLPELEVCTQEDLGYRSDAKEAIAFALFAHACLERMPSNVKSVTGAAKSVVLGSITNP